jgi:hypothetical protein
MTNSIQAQATHTKAAISPVSIKTQAGYPKPDISNSETKVIEIFPVVIKDFGNDVQCDSLQALISTLTKDFKGKHISIKSVLPSGIVACMFVTVSKEGELSDTYTETLFF